MKRIACGILFTAFIVTVTLEYFYPDNLMLSALKALVLALLLGIGAVVVANIAFGIGSTDD